MNKIIPYGRQCIEDDDIEEVVRVLKSDFLTTGPEVSLFEEAFAEKVGAKYAVAVANGTAALHAAVFCLELLPGDEVITTPITFAATSNAVLYAGATPVFVDVDPDTYNIDLNQVEKNITDKTRAIIPVHLSGQPCNMDAIAAIAEKYNLKVIEDASHALGAYYKDKPIGSLSDMTTFSLHPVKHITTGEGGVITTNDESLYKKLCLFRSHGITRDITKMLKFDGPWYYEQQALGFNYRLTDFQAALGRSQLKKLERFVERRIEIAKQYDEGFKDFKKIVIPKQLENTKSSWHLYIIKINFDTLGLSKVEVFENLKNAGIICNVHYIPVYKHPYYKENGFEKTHCKVAETLYDCMLSIPIYPSMTDEDVDYVINTIKQVLS